MRTNRPAATHEVILAGWLIVKGFNPSTIALTSARMEINEQLRNA